MILVSNDFNNGSQMPAELAFCAPDPDTHVTLSTNCNPHLSWSDVPADTQSFALICCDPDVPSKPDDVNQEGKEVPSDLPRIDFYHWILVNIPASQSEIEKGSHSNTVTPKGKPGPDAQGNMRHGINDYTLWFAGDENMGGDYYGYDGPCPPWNDTIIHHYHFTLYALDTDKIRLPEKANGQAALKAIEAHVLDTAQLMGTYSLNPDVS